MIHNVLDIGEADLLFAGAVAFGFATALVLGAAFARGPAMV